MSGEPLAELAAAVGFTLRRRRALGARRLGVLELPEGPVAAPNAPQKEQPETRRPAYEPPGRKDAAAPGPAAPSPPDAADGVAAVPAAGPAPRVRAAAAGTLEELRAAVAGCTACELASSRTRTVFGDGTGRSRVLFVGEAPGAEEDRTGTPFVGPAGQLLTDIITKGMGLAREDVAIANVLKCRPPRNRDPLPGEKELCTGWLDRQIELLDPRVIIPLGRHAANHLLGTDLPLGRLRAQVHEVNGRKIVPTYHPAYLLRSPHDKKKAWADIQLAMAEAGLSRPGN